MSDPSKLKCPYSAHGEGCGGPPCNGSWLLAHFGFSARSLFLACPACPEDGIVARTPHPATTADALAEESKARSIAWGDDLRRAGESIRKLQEELNTVLAERDAAVSMGTQLERDRNKWQSAALAAGDVVQKITRERDEALRERDNWKTRLDELSRSYDAQVSRANEAMAARGRAEERANKAQAGASPEEAERMRKVVEAARWCVENSRSDDLCGVDDLVASLTALDKVKP